MGANGGWAAVVVMDEQSGSGLAPQRPSFPEKHVTETLEHAFRYATRKLIVGHIKLTQMSERNRDQELTQITHFSVGEE